jgi:hypothetical protein
VPGVASILRGSLGRRRLDRQRIARLDDLDRLLEPPMERRLGQPGG